MMLFLISDLGIAAAIIHGVVVLSKAIRRRYSAARMLAATAAASCSPA
jgi:hypothetical protein